MKIIHLGPESKERQKAGWLAEIDTIRIDPHYDEVRLSVFNGNGPAHGTLDYDTLVDLIDVLNAERVRIETYREKLGGDV